MKKLYRIGASLLFFNSICNRADVDWAMLLMMAAVYSLLAAIYEEIKKNG